MNIPPVVSVMIASVPKAVNELRNAIKNVKLDPYYDGMTEETFTFEIVGDKHHNGKFRGTLTGKTRDYCIGHSEEADRSIAVSCILNHSVEKL